ncbi:MAG: proton-conducting transporter membrane subunit [bacterium]
MVNFFIGAGLLFAGGIAAIFFNDNLKGKVFLIFTAVSQIFILPDVFNSLLYGRQFEIMFSLSEPIGNSFFRLDPLASVFVLIISLGGLLASVYSIGYMKMYEGGKYSLSSYYFFLGMMLTSMLLVVTCQNAILFLVVWEIMSAASFFLVTFENNKEDVRKAGIYYFIAMQIGAAFLIAAFSWTSAVSGSLDFNSFKSVLGNSGSNAILLFVLFLAGFGTKAGFVPMHTWLPKAHPAAPTGVSALMSGVMIKTGIYGILRIILLSGSPDIVLAYVIFTLGLVTGIIGIVNTISQKDFKKLLAYSSIENIGIIGAGIGLGMLGLVYEYYPIAALGFLGGLLHTINHFTFKSVLFYGAGVVYSYTHTRNIDKLGGLAKHLPRTAVMFLIASLAICGFPILNGFIGEFAIYLGITKNFAVSSLVLNIFSIFGISALAFIGSAALLSFSKLFGIAFLGSPRTDYPPTKTENKMLLYPMVILIFAMFVIGLFPALLVTLLKSVVTQFIPGHAMQELIEVASIYNKFSIVVLIFLAMILFFYSIRNLLLRKREVKTFKTWDCGYQAESSRIQYTSSSFVQPFLNLVGELIPQKIKVDKEPVLFPSQASLESHTQDFSERFLIRPPLRFLNKLMNKLSWIQSGRMQQYLVYGLIFLIILLIWIIGGE